MTESFMLDAYLGRIGYFGDRTPVLSTLTDLLRRHVTTFPFENINTFMGWPVPLDIQSLQAKFVTDGRGGYCYEQNLLFKAALESIGFSVTGLAARVMMDRPPESRPARTHMLLKVDLGAKSYLVDAGFGGMTLTTPIQLVADETQNTSHESRRLIQDGDEYIMQAHVRDEWRTLYRLSLTPCFLSDFEVCNWYVSTHPNSHFTKGLTVARVTATGRFTLRNNDFAFHDLDGNSERKLLTNVSDLRTTLAENFLINLPRDEEFHLRLKTLVETDKD